MACRFSELVIDCQDHDLVGEFWAAVLGYDISERSDGPENWYVELKGPAGSGPTILVFRVLEEKTVKDRIHIDVSATDREQAEEVERIIALGAKRIDIGQGEQSWAVLADPEGNEFCVLKSRVEPY
ncbi:MAG: VOC family protein [Mycobacteriales bacterium]